MAKSKIRAVARRPSQEVQAKAKKIRLTREAVKKCEKIRQLKKESGDSIDEQNQWAEKGIRLEREAGRIILGTQKQPGVGGGRGKKKKTSIHSESRNLTPYEQLIKESGINRSLAIRWQWIARIPESKFEEYIERRRDHSVEILRRDLWILGKIRGVQDGEPAIEVPIARNMAPIIGDFRKVNVKKYEGKASLIFCDPPYDKESLPIYEDLGKFAARMLKPGGHCIVYFGQYAMPQVCEMMMKSLRYLWILGLQLKGPSARLDVPLIFIGWKPLLWFCNGKPIFRKKMCDFIVSPEAPGKEDHGWEQSAYEAEYCIDHLTLPGELVIDPMAGSGTTGIAAINKGRRQILIEKESRYKNIIERGLFDAINRKE
jgi:16S rRNA G966 N2-methylase RsmD